METGVTLILNGVTITANDAVSPITITSSKLVTVELTDGTINTLDSSNVSYAAGLMVAPIAVATISGDTGTLIAKGGYSCAGIGGVYNGACGTISITGGTVSATGGITAAGIGGGYNGAGGTISISGGTVTATGGDYSTGIGGGCDVSGGTVTASGSIRAMSDLPNLAGYASYSATASTNEDGSGSVTYTAAELANYKYIKIKPELLEISGTVTLELDPTSGEVTAEASGGNVSKAGTLTYSWSGGATGTGTTKTPTLGAQTTCTVTADNATSSIQANITVYKVTLTKTGNTAADEASIARPYAKNGDIVTIDYRLAAPSGSQLDRLLFSAASMNPNDTVTVGNGNSKYTIASADATSGTITLTAAFKHMYTLSFDLNKRPKHGYECRIRHANRCRHKERV